VAWIRGTGAPGTRIPNPQIKSPLRPFPACLWVSIGAGRAHPPAHAEAVYERATKTVRCITCAVVTEPVVNEESQPEPADPQPAEVADPGIAGSSARREYERRKAKDEERLREKWGPFGGLAVALSDERQSTKVWEHGAVGEERLGARLDSLASAEIAVLHDRRIPGTKANIDHIVVTKAGIWVIDAKRYKGRPELKIEGGILRPRVEKLFVGRRDCTNWSMESSSRSSWCVMSSARSR
jgi:Nuclease-related domain